MTTTIHFRSLNEAINSNDFNLSCLNRLLNNGDVQINFWGSRLIKVNDYSDSIEIYVIADRLSNFVKSNQNSLSESECHSGLACIQRMREFYKLSDDKIANSIFFTRVWSIFRHFLEYLFDPLGQKSARGAIQIETDEIYTYGPFNVKEALKSRLRINTQESTTSASNFEPPRDYPRDLRNFGLLLTCPTIPDNVVRSRFDSLPRTYQNSIKHRMWLDAAAGNPNFAASQNDWAGDQIRSNPIPRGLLSAAVQFYLNATPVNTSGRRNPFITELDRLENRRREEESNTRLSRARD